MVNETTNIKKFFFRRSAKFNNDLVFDGVTDHQPAVPGSLDCAEVVATESHAVDNVPLVFGNFPKLFAHVGDDGVDAGVSVVHLKVRIQFKILLVLDYPKKLCCLNTILEKNCRA